VQFQIRRAGVIDPGLYTLGQLQGFTGSGHLLPTDEVSVAGANVWQPMQQAIASIRGQGGQVETSPPHLATPQFPQPIASHRRSPRRNGCVRPLSLSLAPYEPLARCELP